MRYRKEKEWKTLTAEQKAALEKTLIVREQLRENTMWLFDKSVLKREQIWENYTSISEDLIKSGLPDFPLPDREAFPTADDYIPGLEMDYDDWYRQTYEEFSEQLGTVIYSIDCYFKKIGKWYEI